MLLAAFVWATAACVLAEEPVAPTESAAADYNTSAAPLFKKYCAGCHNPTDKEGELVLDSYASVIAGGPNGPLVVPGKADESRLLKVLTGKDEPAMPPEDNPKPTPEEIARLAAWINAGAKEPVAGTPDPTVVSVPQIKPTAPVHEAVSAIAFSPDGKSLAAARFDHIELLALPQRTLARRIGPQRGRINAVRFSADGSKVLAASGEPGVFGEVRLWNVADGTPAGMFAGHADSLYAAVLSPDGKLLATSSYDQQIKLWDVASGKELRTLTGHNDAVFDLAFRPDGKILASASGDRTVKLWDVASGERLDTLGQPTKEQYCLAFSPDGKRVAAGGADNRIRIWQVSDAAKENTNPIVYSRFAHEGAVVNLVYAADGKSIVSAGEDRTVKIWDAEKLLERLPLERQSDWAPALAVSPDSKTVAVGRLDGGLAFYDMANGQVVQPPPPPKPELASLGVRGIQKGTTTRLKLSGKHLAGMTAVKGSHDKIAASIVSQSDTEAVVDVTPAADLPRGRYELYVVSLAGESQKQRLYLDELQQLAEAEPNDAQADATPVALEAGVWGVLAAKGDVDRFVFEAKAGQPLVFDVSGASIGSKANLVLTISDVAGRVLADNNDFGTTSDPLLAFTPPSDGKYVATVSDLMRDGGEEFTYRLTLGELAMPIAVYPLSVPTGAESEVTVSGYNLPADLKVKLPATTGGEIEVPVDAQRYRQRDPLKVVVGSLSESLEVEPNDAPETATALAVPGTVGGRIYSATGRSSTGNDADHFRFESKAGQTWVVETEAQRRGSPVDTVIEVLDAAGKPVERVLLQAVRDSNVTFRGIDGNTRDCRLVNWEEMQLNQLAYLNGEVVKLFRAPRGPDSGFLFYEGDGGKRLLYYDTSATVHAVEEPCYIVEAHQPGTKLISTGLPVFPIYYTNDDDAQRRLGSDSRLMFTAPADGSYLVRVRDTRGASGERFAYRLTVRQPQPDFNVSIGGGEKVAAGSGDSFSVSVDRVDGFEEAVQLDIANVPQGLRISSPVVVQPGHRVAMGVISADADAKQPTPESLAQITVTAKGMVNNAEVVKPVKAFHKLKLEAKPKLLVRLEPAELVIAPGTTIPATLKVERNGHDDLIKFEVENLPHGVIVDNIGLSGVLMPKGESERQIFLTADAWVPETTRLCFAIEQQAGGQCSPPVTIHVRKPSSLAEVKQ
jgi:WD40 repeat protein/mono/diheme cytochrome c family protein